MTGPTLLIISLGELGTNVLEAVARSGIFDHIVVGGRSLSRARARAGNAMIGAGIEGRFPRITAVELDPDSRDFAARVRQTAPDFIFTAPSLLPWWKLDPAKPQMPFAGYTSLHLAPMLRFRDQIAAADTGAFWIGASYPDVINAVLCRTGYGPDCGIGNVQEPIPKIRAGVAQELGCPPERVDVRLVAQHAFEYFVLGEGDRSDPPPCLLQARVGDRDVTALARAVLARPFPFPYDLHFNRVTASAAVVALQALTSPEPRSIHLPGIAGLIGGYPVRASSAGVEIDLPAEWTLDQAVAVNEASLRWDGIESVGADGAIVFTEETRRAFHRLLGKPVDTLTVSNAEQQAEALLSAL